MGDPGVTFFADNFLGGTLFFTDDQVGKYIRALCAQKIEGHLTFDQLNTFAKDDQKVIAKFKVDENGLYYNVRMDNEIKKRNKFSNSQSKKANKRWENDTGAVPGDMPGHSRGNAHLKAYALDDTEIDIDIKTRKKTSNKSRKCASSTLHCERNKKWVPAERHGTYVVLTQGEYQRMIDDWGKKYADSAINEYDMRFPNSKAIKNHTDHNRAIRDYVNRGYLCQGKVPKIREKNDQIKRVPKEECADIDEVEKLVRDTTAKIKSV